VFAKIFFMPSFNLSKLWYEKICSFRFITHCFCREPTVSYGPVMWYPAIRYKNSILLKDDRLTRDFTLEQLRAMPIEQIKFAGPPLMPYPTEDVQRVKITADSIPVLIFNPLHTTGLPVLINYHGGGFISPLIPGLEHSLWQEAKTYGAILFAVDYRVAPEHKFPAAVHDSYNAFKWIASHASTFGGDTNRIVLMGNSAGANLVAVITQKAKKESIHRKIKLQVLNGLPADLSPQNMERSLSYQENAKGYFQTKAACYFAVETYAPGQSNNPEVSPILTEDLGGPSACGNHQCRI
jgi:acetyl esterase